MASIVGTWTLTTDWGCGGSITGSFDQTFNADGTWSSTPFVHRGRWFQVENVVIWVFDDVSNLVYAGNINGSWIEGAQGYTTAGGSKGCFGGHRAGIPAALKTAMAAKKAGDPALGK
jgi:hypothetical protein